MIPATPNNLRAYNTVGPICRYASDLLPMFKVLSKNYATNLKLDIPVSNLPSVISVVFTQGIRLYIYSVKRL